MTDTIAQSDQALLDSLGAERGRRLFRAIFSGLMIRPLAMVIPFISVPLFLKYLGKERYGLYATVISASAWLSLSNVGLTTGLVNKLTDCEVSGDKLLARRYVSSLWFAMVAICLLFTLLASIIVPLVNWGDVFQVKGNQGRSEIATVLWITAIITFIQSILGVPAAAYTAAQQIEKYNYWDGACKLAMLVACILVVHTPLGLMGVALATLGAPCAVRIVNMLVLFTFERPWLRPQIRSFDITLVRSTMADGVCIFLLQIGSLAIVNADKLIIGSVLGSEKVVDFDLLSRLFLLVYGIFALALGSIWPAYGEAARRGDMAWVRNKLLQSMVFGICLMLACGAFMYLFGGTVVRIWTRGEATQVQKSLVIATTAFFAVRALTECQSVVLNAIGVLMPQVWFLGANAILNLIVGVLLAKRYGVVGVAWSFPASALFTTMCGYPYLVRRYLSNSQESRDRRAAIGLRAAARE